MEPTGAVHADERFGEVVRDEPYEGDFRVRRLAYVTGTDYADWEPRDRVSARFAEGVPSWVARADGRPLVVASHGMAMTLWLAATIGLADPGAFWADLRLPDLLAVDLSVGQVTRPGSGVPPGIS